MKKGKLYGIGIGPGDPDLLTIKAVKILHEADVVYVPKSKEQKSTALHIIEEHLAPHAVIKQLEFPMSKDICQRETARKKNAGIIARQLDDGKNTAFITLGDPMFYSTYSYISEFLKAEYEVETIPGIYSFAAISSILNTPLCSGNENISVISAFSDNDKRLIRLSDTAVCMKVSTYHADLYDFLLKNPDYQFSMISNAGKHEQHITCDLEALNTKELHYFSTVILQKKL